MSPAVIVGLVGSIDIPDDVGKGVNAQAQVKAPGTVQVFENANQFSPVIMVRVFDAGG